MQANLKPQPKPQPGHPDFEPASLAESLEHVAALGGFGDWPSTNPDRVARARRGRKTLFSRGIEIR